MIQVKLGYHLRGESFTSKRKNPLRFFGEILTLKSWITHKTPGQ